MRSKRFLAIAAGCLVAILLLLYFLHSRHHGAVSAAATPPPTVAVATARVGHIANQLTVAGVFQPFQEIDVHGKVSGYIRHIYVDIGDRVRQGQTMAVLEVPELTGRGCRGSGWDRPDASKILLGCRMKSRASRQPMTRSTPIMFD